MNIFELDSTNVVRFSPQALMLKPFKDIWNMDKSKDKAIALKELSYIYYMTDDRSDYQYIVSRKERSDEIINNLEIDPIWKPSLEVKMAIAFYESMSETTSTKLLKSTRGVVERISIFLDAVDMNERDRNNRPVFDINKITGAVEKVPKLVKALAEIEKEVIKEKELKSQSGNREAGLFDDGEL